MTLSSLQKGLIALLLAAIFPLVIFFANRTPSDQPRFAAAPVPLFNEGLATDPVPSADAISRPHGVPVIARTLAAANPDQTRCLAQAVYHEARGEPFLGQVGVAFVVVNRMNDKRWPSSVCGIVYQGRDRRNCQFAFACGDPSQPYEARAWSQALRIARAVLEGRLADPTERALYFHGVRPIGDGPTPTVQLGNHYFFRTLES